MTPSQQMQENNRKILELTKAPLVDKLQKCMEQNRALKREILKMKAQLDKLDCHCPPGIREGVLGGPICHACERQLEEMYGDEIPF